MSHDAHPNDHAPTSARGRLLLTKLQPPRAASDGLLRQRLLREIDRGANGKLTLIVTPPGYGKSTIASQWQAYTNRLSAWISLDAADNDFAVFLDYLVAAIQSIDATMCQGLAARIRVGPQLAARQLVELLINDVAEATRPFVLILDDFHVIASEEVLDAVRYLLELMPSNMSIVLTSRVEPNLPTLRMSARGELVELGAADLSFTNLESRGFLLERQDLDLRIAELEQIETWAEGWPVALRLVAGVLRGRSREGIQSLLEALTENVPSVSEYLWDEVIENQPSERREFLLSTSILRQMNPEIAAAVSGNDDAAQLIQSLSRDNQFISRLYGPGNWHRYHHIFADVLRQRLTREVDADTLKSLHGRAANWYLENDLATEAAYHAIQAESWPMAASLLVPICKEFYDQERIGTLQIWLRDLPDEPLTIEPRLAYWLAWSLVRTGRAGDAMRPLAIAEAALKTDTSSEEAIRAALLIRLVQSLLDWNVPAGESVANELLARLGPDDTSEQTRALIMLGSIRETGGLLPEAESALELARVLNGRHGVRGLQTAELNTTGTVQLAMGKLREPYELFRRVVVIGDEWNDLPLQNALHRLAHISYEWNKLDEARAQAERAGELAHRMGAPIHLPQTWAILARIDAVHGEWDRVFDSIEHAIAASSAAGYRGLVPMLEELKCRMWLRSEQLTMAQAWLQRVGPSAMTSPRYQSVPRALTSLRIRLSEGCPDTAIQPLENLRVLAEAQGWFRHVISIQILRALAESALGRLESSDAAMNDALELASPEGFVRDFLDEGPATIPVLTRIARQPGPGRVYAAELLRAAGAATEPAMDRVREVPGVLSPRELDVMRLVTAGLSNRDVGETLFISEETVKTHLRRIFEKLEVTSRTQAINRSQQLGLL